MAHEGSLPLDGDTAGDLVATVVDVLQGGGDDVHVVVGVDTAGDAEAQEVEAAETVLTCHGVAVGKDIAYLTASDTSLEVELAGEGLGGELLLGDVAQHLVGIDEQGVAAGRALIGNAVLVELLGEIVHLVDARLEHWKLGVLVESYGERVQVAAVESAIGEESLEGYAEELGTLV